MEIMVTGRPSITARRMLRGISGRIEEVQALLNEVGPTTWSDIGIEAESIGDMAQQLADMAYGLDDYERGPKPSEVTFGLVAVDGDDLIEAFDIESSGR